MSPVLDHVALRGTPPPGGPAWEVYDPPYGGGAFCFDVHPRSLQDPSVPLVFAMRPPGPPPRLRPGLEPARLRHPNGALGLGWLRFEGGPPPPITAPGSRTALGPVGSWSGCGGLPCRRPSTSGCWS